MRAAGRCTHAIVANSGKHLCYFLERNACEEMKLAGEVAYQLGEYNFTQYVEFDGELMSQELWASAPVLRFAMGLRAGRWKVSGFFAAPEVTKTTVEMEGESGEYLDTFGRVNSLGVDIAYLFDVGTLELGPSVGYRKTVFMIGVMDPDEDADDYIAWEAMGTEISGVRGGARRVHIVVTRDVAG